MLNSLSIFARKIEFLSLEYHKQRMLTVLSTGTSNWLSNFEPTHNLVELMLLPADTCNHTGQSLDGPSLKGWLQDTGFTKIWVRIKCDLTPIANMTMQAKLPLLSGLWQIRFLLLQEFSINKLLVRFSS